MSISSVRRIARRERVYQRIGRGDEKEIYAGVAALHGRTATSDASAEQMRPDARAKEAGPP
jgi:hypothetical protein